MRVKEFCRKVEPLTNVRCILSLSEDSTFTATIVPSRASSIAVITTDVIEVKSVDFLPYNVARGVVVDIRKLTDGIEVRCK